MGFLTNCALLVTFFLNAMSFFNVVEFFDDVLWSYLAVPLLIVSGIYLTIKFRGVQLTNFSKSLKFFKESIFPKKAKESERGLSPLKVFFTSLGGCIGVANLVGVSQAIKYGGPGAIFWMWVAAFFGIAIKYAEIYLGIVYREKNKEGSYDGGPMFYMQKVFKNPLWSRIFAFLLCIYGAEIYIFNVVGQTISTNWSLNPYLVTFSLLFLIFYASLGGIDRVGSITAFIIPLFVFIFLTMGLYLLWVNRSEIIPSFLLIFRSAFSGHAAIGGFVGSTILHSMSEGMKRGCYTGDIGVGYAAVVHAESSQKDPTRQASLVIFEIFLDTFLVCTLTGLMVLVTGVWKMPIDPSMMVQRALSAYFPYLNFFMPLFIFLLGFSTIIAFFSVGLKSAHFLDPKRGMKIYATYAFFALLIFSFAPSRLAIGVMSICGAFLLFLNVGAIFFLAEEIKK